MITGGGEMINDRTTDATADKAGGIQIIGNNTKDGMMTETGTAADADDPNWACQAPSCASLAAVTVDAEDFVDADVVMSLMSLSVGRVVLS